MKEVSRVFSREYKSILFGVEVIIVQKMSRIAMKSSLKTMLQEIVQHNRSHYKAFRDSYGKRVIGSSSVHQLLNGSVDIPTSITYLHQSKWVSPQALFGAQGTEDKVNELKALIRDEVDYRMSHYRRQLADPQKNPYHFLKNLPVNKDEEEYPLTRKCFFQLMAHQPESVFYQERNSVKKTEYWELIAEDALNIVSLITLWRDEAAMVRLSNENSSPPLKMFPTYKAKEMEIDSPFIHCIRLVSSTLSDPYLAVAAICNMMRTSDYTVSADVGNGERLIYFHEAEFYEDLLAFASVGLIHVWWDRVVMIPLANPKSMDLTSLVEFTHQK